MGHITVSGVGHINVCDAFPHDAKWQGFKWQAFSGTPMIYIKKGQSFSA